MQHVSQSFEMHQPVLDGYIEQSSQGKAVTSFGITSEISARELFVESRPGSVHITVHMIERRPISGNVSGQASVDRIDAEGEQPIQFGLRTLQSEDAIPEQIPVERFEVSDIKNDAVALRDRPLVEEVVTNNAEERVALAASLEQAVRELTAGFGAGLGG
jgi:hypothetical protein